MAKRKRKMTLFDVINTGQPIGLQVRQRTPTQQPTPELPVKKKLAKLFGRKSAAPEAERALTAAEQLDAMRRELRPETPREPSHHVHYSEPESEADRPEVTSHEPARPARSRVAELAAAAETAEREAAAPRPPRKPLSQSFRERWAIIQPKLARVGAVVASRASAWSRRGAEASRYAVGQAREVGGRYAVTAMAAAGMIVVLGGAFYSGKLLLNRPAIELPGGDLADGTVRPDVMNLDGPAVRANEPIANLAGSQPDAQLQRKPAESGMFGGRRLDWNYVIVQSYTTQTEAEATVEVLAKYNIAATVEPNLPRWTVPGKTIYSVVSVDGFAKNLSDNQVYLRFLKTIADISAKERGVTLSGRLDPLPYRYQPAQPR